MTNNYSIRGRGLIPDEDDANDKFINMDNLHNHVLPTGRLSIFDHKFKFANSEEKSYQSFGVYNQGQVSSCTSNAVAAAYRYMLQRHDLPDFKPSRLFLYYLARTPDATITSAGFALDQRGSYYDSLESNPPTALMLNDDGTKIRENVRVLAKLGVPSEDEWPYDINKTATHDVYPADSNVAKPPPATLFKNIARQIVFHYVRPHIGDVDCWKRCVANGYPIICGIDEFDTFEDSTCKETFCAITPTQDVGYKTGHTVLVVGWDDEKLDGRGQKGFFRVQNSWGTDSAEKWDGFFWMPYSWVTTDSPHRWTDDNGNLRTNKLAYSAWVLVDRSDLVGTGA
jgi:C1A family cysteine protease